MEEEITTQTFTPRVEKEHKPKVGQEFESIEVAYEFYNNYAKEAGFSARMSTTKKRSGANGHILKKFGIVRVACKAKIIVVRNKSSPYWIVSSLLETHNHAPTTLSRLHLLRLHCHISNAKKALVQQLFEANVSTNQQISLMEIEYGGPQNIGCIERDIRNYERDLKEEIKGIDAESLIETFALGKEKDSGFYFDFDKDGDDRLVRCFWVDSFSRRAYNFFGDVVVFDTTYNTNRYRMIFAPFIGVNHHGQTILFGCGFLSDETIDSFVWLLG
ncbi:protein FAR1-RELATED SEQUENCE 5-like [Olea europaea var. sylvestris]|uniref:protein FAR1-RELATED SEQUENCE 5-like n=1 Tax=Olea europaea var. sylvestris TaxID=158386 RepID=UPI000C1D57E8|nr:protein FAR1-RELATED SEQUENCE 5-like [Olea europaea var. sylvestris]